jgi:DNA repair protein RadD
VPADKAKEPFFAKQIVHISGRDLLDQGYVSPVTIGAINESYDTDGLEINSMGKFTSESIDRAFTGHGRKTSAIIADIISKSKDRRSVLIFASTHKHADECMASLPKELSAVLNDKTSKAERTRIIQDFKSFKIKYLVNVGILSRGFDHPGLDVVALLRATESSALLHQIIGRLVRLSPGKEDGLLLDYATNLDMHHPDGDLFSPEIKSWNDKKSSTQIIAECPLCSTENTFSARKNDEGYLYDSQGYFTDLTGERIKGDFGEIPSHHGRRCYGQELVKGKFERCLYYWTHKTCETCGEKCDISARYCSSKHELIDPNKNLIAEYRPHKIDPYQAQKERVIAWTQKKMKSKRDEDMLMVTYITETRKFVIFYLVRRPEYGELMKATNGGDTMPTEIMYRKDKQSNFYRVLGYV